MTFQLVCIEPKELTQYKADMQEAFQKGFEDAFLGKQMLFCLKRTLTSRAECGGFCCL